MMTFELLGIGIIVGFLGTLLGIGGGVFLVPFLVLVIKTPIHQAIAASLITIIATSSQVASFGLRHKLTNIRLAFLLNLSSATGAIVTSFIATRIEEKVIETIFSIILFTIAGLMLMRTKTVTAGVPETDSKVGYFGGGYYDHTRKKYIRYETKNIAAASGLVLFSGMVAGIAGTSGGIFNIPILNMVSRVPIKVATMTSSLMIGVTACAGSMVYFGHHLVQPLLVGPIVVGVLAGTTVGKKAALRLHSKWLKRIFVLLLIATAIKLIFR